MRQKPNQDWTEVRVARLGYLVGIGWDGERIAADLGTNANNIYRQAARTGLSFHEATRMRKAMRKAQEQKPDEPIFAAAKRRRITRDELIDRLLEQIESDPVLIDNILDDAEYVARAA
jgi:hypothetical protein